jgi:DNA-binding NtrC family response regulator
VRLQVVYVDDEKVLLEIFRELFGEEYEVRTFSSSVEALADIQRCSADVVFSDLAMPELNGYELLKEVATLCPHSVRVMMTGFANAGDMIPNMMSGLVEFFIAKPWHEGQIYEVLERASLKLKGRLVTQ